MAKRKVQGGKRIDTWSIEIEDKPFEVEVYMTKVTTRPYSDTMPPLGATLFVAISDEFNIRHENLDINALQKAVEKTLRERVVVVWERKLLVTVEGDRIRKDERGWYNPEKVSEPRNGHPHPTVGCWGPERSVFGHGSNSHRLDTTKRVEVKIEAVEIATVAGEKKWRYTGLPAPYKSNDIKDGWPKTGDLILERYGSKDLAGVAGLVTDNEGNRAALLAIVQAMEGLVAKLDALLTQENIQGSLVRILSSSLAPISLPAAIGKV